MFWLRFRVLSSFLACLLLWLVNKKVRNRWRGVDELYSFYLLHHANRQTHLIVSSIKIIIKHVAVEYRFKSARMVSCWDLYAFSWAVICQYSWCYQASMTIYHRLEDCFIMYRFTSQTNMQHFMFEQIDLHIFLPVIYQ